MPESPEHPAIIFVQFFRWYWRSAQKDQLHFLNKFLTSRTFTLFVRSAQSGHHQSQTCTKDHQPDRAFYW